MKRRNPMDVKGFDQFSSGFPSMHLERMDHSHHAINLIDQFMTNNNDSVNNATQDCFGDFHGSFPSHANIVESYNAQLFKKTDRQVSQISQTLTSNTSHASIFKESNSHEFIRSTSAGTGWTNLQDPVIPLGTSNAHPAFPRFSSFVGFPRFNPFEMQSTLPIINHDKKIPGNTTSDVLSQNMCSEIFQSTIMYHSTMANSYSFSEGGMQLQELYANSESESDEDDVDDRYAISQGEDDANLMGTIQDKTEMLAIEAPPVVDPRKERAFRIANELLTTEESYVKVLHLIDQVFHFRVDQENRAHSMFPQEMIPQMFSNIKSIYKLHSELLPQLKDRIDSWEKDPRIGDIMKNFAPFLKMYSDYVKNFDNAMNIINAMHTKNKRFSDIVNDIQKMEECKNLTICHHMLSPIQRIPRYEMLLKDYLKKLPDDSRDKADTENALHLVSTAATHANDTMKRIAKFKHLLEIQEGISGVVDLVSPTRELLKEGKVHKISARSGDHQERYLFLFTDCLFLCSHRMLPNRVILGPLYRLRAKFTFDYMQWCEGDNLETTNTFYIRDSTKNVELYTHTPEEKSSWRDVFLEAIQEFYKRKSSLRIGNDAEIGLERRSKAPSLIKMDGVTKCMECQSNFGVMKRKHHCRACGLVVCSKCSNQKIALPFEETKISRVCKNCFHTISQQLSTIPTPNQSPVSEVEETGKTYINLAFNRDKGVLEVQSDAEGVISGYLQLKTQGKSWLRRWFSLHKDFVLYSFLTDNEQRAMTATPVPGFTVAKVTNKGDSISERMFKMFHSRKTYFFQAASKREVEKWVDALQKSAQAELPSPIINNDCVDT